VSGLGVKQSDRLIHVKVAILIFVKDVEIKLLALGAVAGREENTQSDGKFAEVNTIVMVKVKEICGKVRTFEMSTNQNESGAPQARSSSVSLTSESFWR
jgi:hypothetical protein